MSHFSKEDAENILKYLREPCMVLKPIKHDHFEVTQITSKPYLTSKDTYTVIFVPGYGPVHVEPFLEKCKEMGLEV